MQYNVDLRKRRKLPKKRKDILTIFSLKQWQKNTYFLNSIINVKKSVFYFFINFTLLKSCAMWPLNLLIYISAFGYS